MCCRLLCLCCVCSCFVTEGVDVAAVVFVVAALAAYVDTLVDDVVIDSCYLSFVFLLFTVVFVIPLLLLRCCYCCCYCYCCVVIVAVFMITVMLLLLLLSGFRCDNGIKKGTTTNNH